MNIKSILAVIYVHKKIVMKLINHPEINCNMSIPSYHYFSNNILCGFPGRGINRLSLAGCCLRETIMNNIVTRDKCMLCLFSTITYSHWFFAWLRHIHGMGHHQRRFLKVAVSPSMLVWLRVYHDHDQHHSNLLQDLVRFGLPPIPTMECWCHLFQQTLCFVIAKLV